MQTLSDKTLVDRTMPCAYQCLRCGNYQSAETHGEDIVIDFGSACNSEQTFALDTKDSIPGGLRWIRSKDLPARVHAQVSQGLPIQKE